MYVCKLKLITGDIMCRILSYLGKPILIEELLYKPDNSFIKQSYHPKYMSHLLNLGWFWHGGLGHYFA